VCAASRALPIELQGLLVNVLTRFNSQSIVPGWLDDASWAAGRRRRTATLADTSPALAPLVTRARAAKLTPPTNER